MNGIFDLTGKRVVITGGTSGIGLATARAFLDAGAQVLISGRSAERGAAALQALGGGDRAGFLAADAGSPDDNAALAEAALGQMGGTDVLVCVAGFNLRARPEEVPLEDFDAVLDANLRGTFLSTRAFYEQLCDSGDGRIVTIGSMLSVLANDVSPAYAAAKGGVVQLTRTLAVAWAGKGIRANCVLPGWIDTPLTRGAREKIPTLDRRVRERTPAGRWGRPEEVAGTILFLATPASRFVTGTAIPVDGGYLIGT